MFVRIKNVLLRIKEENRYMRIKKLKRREAIKAQVAPAEWQEFIEI
ncbi:hypothetical protein IJI18_02640 [Candidatus Saccharibacteria bacterium]|nr:hypothetical protein [Candidatus Saccharibacteria bacterium]